MRSESGGGRRGGSPVFATFERLDPVRLVGDLLVNEARARRVGKLVEAAFQRFNHDELAPLHAQMVELGFTGHDAALILGGALRMAAAGIETFDE